MSKWVKGSDGTMIEASVQLDAAGNVYGSRQTFAATIASGQADSGLIDLSGGSGLSLVGILMPAGWTAAALGFQITLDNGSTWTPVYNASGVLVQVQSPPVSGYIALDPADFAGIAKLRLTSRTSGTTTAVNQGADRTFTVVARSL